MSCCYTCLFERTALDWDDIGAKATASIPIGFDLDLDGAAAGSVVVAIHASAVDTGDGAGAQLVGYSVVSGCEADDEQDFIGPEVFRGQLGAAAAGEAVALPIPHDATGTARLFVDVTQGATVASQSIEVSVWLRSPCQAEAHG